MIRTRLTIILCAAAILAGHVLFDPPGAQSPLDAVLEAVAEGRPQMAARHAMPILLALVAVGSCLLMGRAKLGITLLVCVAVVQAAFPMGLYGAMWGGAERYETLVMPAFVALGVLAAGGSRSRFGLGLGGFVLLFLLLNSPDFARSVADVPEWDEWQRRPVLQVLRTLPPVASLLAVAAAGLPRATKLLARVCLACVVCFLVALPWCVLAELPTESSTEGLRQVLVAVYVVGYGNMGLWAIGLHLTIRSATAHLKTRNTERMADAFD